jgi:hypothetical protein
VVIACEGVLGEHLQLHNLQASRHIDVEQVAQGTVSAGFCSSSSSSSRSSSWSSSTEGRGTAGLVQVGLKGACMRAGTSLLIRSPMAPSVPASAATVNKRNSGVGELRSQRGMCACGMQRQQRQLVSIARLAQAGSSDWVLHALYTHLCAGQPA